MAYKFAGSFCDVSAPSIFTAGGTVASGGSTEPFPPAEEAFGGGETGTGIGAGIVVSGTEDTGADEGNIVSAAAWVSSRSRGSSRTTFGFNTPADTADTGAAEGGGGGGEIGADGAAAGKLAVPENMSSASLAIGKLCGGCPDCCGR